MTISATAAYITTRANQVKDAYSLWEAMQSTEAFLNLTKEVFQMAGVAAAATVIDSTLLAKIFEKTGLDRIFDSLKKDVPYNDYLTNQLNWAATREAGVAFTIDQFLDWLNNRHLGAELYDILHPSCAAVRPPVPQWVYNPFVDPLDGGISDFDPNSLASIQAEIAEGELTIRFIPPTDPLILDLNGNGIQTVGTSAGVRFDHNGSGVKQLTGWIAATDGFLVMDRNGNGVIDNGTELFGNSTPLSTGGAAADGYAALAQQDSNGDGKVDSLDANWANLKVWQDLNQDGISQAGELAALADLGIAALALNNPSLISVPFGIPQANGNDINATGSFTRTDGSTGATADVNLALDPLTRSFSAAIPITAAAAAQSTEAFLNLTKEAQATPLFRGFA